MKTKQRHAELMQRNDFRIITSTDLGRQTFLYQNLQQIRSQFNDFIPDTHSQILPKKQIACGNQTLEILR